MILKYIQIQSSPNKIWNDSEYNKDRTTWWIINKKKEEEDIQNRRSL